MTMQPTIAKRNPITAALMWGAMFGLVSVMSRPGGRGADWLAAQTDSGLLAVVGAHLIPVLAAMAAIGATTALSGMIKNRVLTTAMLALSGGVAGFVFALFLDVFAAVAPLILGWLGPLAEASAIDVVGWTLALLSAFTGILTAAFGLFGAGAMRAMSIPDADPSCYDVRRAERSIFLNAGIGMTGHGMLVAALVLAHQATQAQTAALIGLAGVLVVGTGLYVWSGLALWAAYDELMRRIVMDALAWSAVIATPFVLAAGFMAGAGIGPTIGFYEASILFLLLQCVCAIVLSATLNDQLSPAQAAAE